MEEVVSRCGLAGEGRGHDRSSPRVQRLRQRIIDAPREVCVERARYLTQSMAANWDLHPLTRMSMALEHILDNMSVVIRDDELIVGCRTSKLKGAPLFPENKSKWIEGDLEAFDKRVLQKVLITEEEQRELREEILPFWRGRTVEDRLEELLPPDVAEDMDKYIFTMVLEITYGIGHFTMNHPRVLKLGLAGIIAEAQERYDALTPEERQGEKGLFYDAVIRSLRAAIRFAHRYADLAESLAEREADPERAEELRTIARVCRRVPEHPAQTFHEAVQCVYFIHLIAQIESGGNSISLGRIDQILYPYYLADRQAGRITPGAGPGAALAAVHQDQRDLERPRGGVHPRRRGRGGQDDAERDGRRRRPRRRGRHQRAELHRARRLRRRADGAAQLRGAPRARSAAETSS